MNVVDSSGWLEYFANGSNADYFAPAITDEPNLVVPTICMFEVFKRLSQQLGKEPALQAMGMLYRGQVVALNDEIALHAALLSLEHKLPLADSVILATARLHDATLWTQDEHFRYLPGVEFIEKK
ncbi:MAG TPA: type II toxin-antitoxin system VapC family toxin [Anaerolineales bacterium]|nr:type II toxin-antitoxin system VapC family toxin [Anaerolineales bacterium]